MLFCELRRQCRQGVCLPAALQPVLLSGRICGIVDINEQNKFATHIHKYLANKRDVRLTHVLTVTRFFDNAAWPANGSICIYFRMTNANEMLAAYLGPVVCDGHSPIFPKDCPSGMLIW